MMIQSREPLTHHFQPHELLHLPPALAALLPALSTPITGVIQWVTDGDTVVVLLFDNRIGAGTVHPIRLTTREGHFVDAPELNPRRKASQTEAQRLRIAAAGRLWRDTLRGAIPPGTPCVLSLNQRPHSFERLVASIVVANGDGILDIGAWIMGIGLPREVDPEELERNQHDHV